MYTRIIVYEYRSKGEVSTKYPMALGVGETSTPNVSDIKYKGWVLELMARAVVGLLTGPALGLPLILGLGRLGRGRFMFIFIN